MANKKQIDPNILLIAGGGIVGLILIKQLMVKFGLAAGPGEKKFRNNIQDPGSPWKPNYFQTQAATRANCLLINPALADYYASQIYTAFGVFQDDYNKVLSVFESLKTKCQVSFLAYRFQIKYGQSLSSYLIDGGGLLPWDGLSDEHLNELANLVNRLPSYRP